MVSDARYFIYNIISIGYDFASDAQSGVNGNVVRVCGQSLLGA